MAIRMALLPNDDDSNALSPANGDVIKHGKSFNQCVKSPNLYWSFIYSRSSCICFNEPCSKVKEWQCRYMPEGYPRAFFITLLLKQINAEQIIRER